MASAGEGRGDAFRQEIRQRQLHRTRGLEAALGRARLLAGRLDEEGHLDSEEKREALLIGVYAGTGVGRLLQHAKELHEMEFERRAQEADLRRAALLGQQAALALKGEDGAPEEGGREEVGGPGNRTAGRRRSSRLDDKPSPYGLGVFMAEPNDEAGPSKGAGDGAMPRVSRPA